MNAVIKILIAEHDKHDLEMIDTELKKGDIGFVSEIVQTESGYRKALKNFLPDIIFSDYTFPSFSGLVAFTIREEVAPDTPFILISGTIGEENSIELIKNGVTDFVLKDKIFTLNTKLVRALKEAEDKKQKNKTAKELAQSEKHLAEAQRLAKMGSWDFDFKTDRLTWSKELYNVFGIGYEKFNQTYDSFINLVDEEDRFKVQQTSRHTQLTGDHFTIEYHITTPLGEKRVIREQGYGKKNDTGKITHLFGTAQDITATKKAEAAIKKAFDEKNAILESIDDGFFAIDNDSLVTYWNRKAEILLGEKREAVIGRNLHEMFAKPDSRIFYENYQKAIREKSTVHFEGFSTRANKWFAVSAFASDKGLSVYFKDVTEQKNAAEKIKESELRYRSLIEQATDTICLWDASGKFIEVNPSGCTMLGYSREEILELFITDVLVEEDLRVNPIRIGELKAGKITHNERRIKRKDGTLIEVELSSKMIEDGRIMVFGRDITERKKTENKIKESELRYRSIIEQSTDAICIADASMKIMDINAYGCQMLGYNREEFLRLTITDLFLPEDLKANPFKIEELKSGKIIRNERRFIKKDGTLIEVEMSGRMLEDGRFIIFGHDIAERKESERLIKESEAKYRSFFESSMDGILLTVTDGAIQSANPAACDIFKMTEEEICAAGRMGLADLSDPRLHTLIEERQRTGRAKGELTLLRKDGSKFEAELSSAVFTDSDGLDRTSMIIRDISERKAAEFNIHQTTKELQHTLHKIEASEKRYRQIVETAQEGIWLIDENHKTTFVNHKMYEILEYTEAEMMGKEIYFFMDEEGKQLAEEFRKKMKQGHTGQIIKKYLSKTGKEIWANVSVNPLFYKDGTYQGSLAMVTDITQRKKAEIKDQFQATLLNTIGQATIATDLQGKINFWNKAASKIYGWTEEEVFGKDIVNITTPQQTKEQAKQIMQELMLGNSWSGEFMVRRKDGSEFPAFVTNAPIYDEQQQLIGIIGVSSDITRRKQAELQLKESNERYKRSEMRLNELNSNLQVQAKELAISNADLEQFAYVASHDLQEPLRMVTSFLTQLEKKYGAVIDDKGRQYIDFAVDGARRMRQIILDLLEFSRVGRTENMQESVDLNELVDEIQILCRKQILEKKAIIISNPLPHVIGYRSPLRQVFQNLISNALKYAKKEQATKINITCTELTDHWQFEVNDNGIGIEKEYFDKIFIIFQRLHNKDEFMGTGMGLAITKKIIETHGGRIWVESEAGKGSTFYFTLLKN